MDVLRVNLAERSAELNGDLVVLAPRQFDLLAVLAAEPRRVFHQHELLTLVWGWPADSARLARTRTVSTTIYRLRRALGIEGPVGKGGAGWRLAPAAGDLLCSVVGHAHDATLLAEAERSLRAAMAQAAEALAHAAEALAALEQPRPTPPQRAPADA